jgi:hypothetical protein
VPRKILFIVALLIVPGGLIALAFASLAKVLQQTPRGRELIASARRRAPVWATSSAAQQDQAA